MGLLVVVTWLLDRADVGAGIYVTEKSHPARKLLHEYAAFSTRLKDHNLNIFMQHITRKACREVDVWGKKTFVQVPAAKKFYTLTGYGNFYCVQLVAHVRP